MVEKSFIELERAREAAIQCSPRLLSQLEALKEACKRLNISPAQKDAAKKISAALVAQRYGIDQQYYERDIDEKLKNLH